MGKEYVASPPNGFYDPIISPIKMMSILKKQIKGKKIKPVIDLQSIFLWQLMISQWRQMELGPLCSAFIPHRWVWLSPKRQQIRVDETPWWSQDLANTC